jgi:hypothetical protein
MKIKVYEDRYLVAENIIGSQYENLATTLEFEFPEFIEKNGTKIPTSQLNKYIVFDIDQEENQDIIINNRYSIPYELTKLEELTFLIKLIEFGDETDISNKLIWNSQSLTISFNNGFEGNTNVTSEKMDAFNSAVTTLTEKTNEVDTLIDDINTKIENGDFNGDDGLTPYIKDGFWYIGELNTEVDAEAISIKQIEKVNSIDNKDVYVITFSNDGIFTFEVTNGVDGKDYIITEQDYEKIEIQVKNDIQPILDEIRNISENAETIAKGRATGYVFDTFEEMESWLQSTENTSKLVLGDNLYIRAVGVPDYWWDGNAKQVLETQKVDLSEYATKKDFEEQIGDIASVLDTINGEVI